MKKSLYILFFTIALSLSSCNNEDFLWQDATYARIYGPKEWTLETDSLIFSFAPYNTSIKEYVINAKIFIIGSVSKIPLTVRIEVDPASTASTSHYSFPESVTIPAGSHFVEFPISLKRTSDLTSKQVKLILRISDSGDIGKGVKEFNQLKLTWSDMISKPTNWTLLTEFFGNYSNTKYRFIIDVLGIGIFTYGETNGMTWGEMNYYRMKMIEALTAYNAAHPGNPLTDENNQIVTF